MCFDFWLNVFPLPFHQGYEEAQKRLKMAEEDHKKIVSTLFKFPVIYRIIDYCLSMKKNTVDRITRTGRAPQTHYVYGHLSSPLFYSFQSCGRSLAGTTCQRERLRSWRTWRRRSPTRSTCSPRTRWLRGSGRSWSTSATSETWPRTTRKPVPRRKRRGRTDTTCRRRRGVK